MRRQPLQATSFLLREALCSLILGAIPCTLIAITSSVEALLAFFRGLVPPDIVVWFFLVLMLIHFAVWTLNYFWIKPTDNIDAAFNSANELSEQIGFSLLGLYRAVAGAILVIAPSIMVSEPTQNNLILLGVSYFFAACCIWACCMLSYAQTKRVARAKSQL